MNDKEARAQEKRIFALEKYWRPVMGLGGWIATFDFYRGDIPGHEDAVGVAHVNWEYMRATLRFNLLSVADMDDEALEYIYVHEVMHVIVNEMRDDVDDIKHEERVVTQLARLAIRARVAGR